MLFSLSVEVLHNGLCFTHFTSPSHLGALHHAVLSEHIGIDVGVELFSLTGDFHLPRDDSQAFGAIKGRVHDLGLEWEVRDGTHVQILHLEQLRDGLHTILKGEDCLCSRIAETTGRERLIF